MDSWGEGNNPGRNYSVLCFMNRDSDPYPAFHGRSFTRIEEILLAIHKHLKNPTYKTISFTPLPFIPLELSREVFGIDK
jgi:hypothetical protein